MTTPLWVPLFVAALGFISTVVGIVVTQVMANRRERQAWQRETVRERERWQREDQARTFEHRRVAYVEFYEALRKMELRVHNHAYGLSDEADEDDLLPFGWQTDTFEKFQHLELYASPRVAPLAIAAYDAVYRWGVRVRHGQIGETYHDDDRSADEAKRTLLEALRADLNVPDRPSTRGNLDKAQDGQEPPDH